MTWKHPGRLSLGTLSAILAMTGCSGDPPPDTVPAQDIPEIQADGDIDGETGAGDAASDAADAKADAPNLDVEPDMGAPPDGATVYGVPMEEGNTFACATCHAIEEPAEDGIRRVGHRLGDATRRPSYKNGLFVDMLDAVNSCLDGWMNAPEWQEDSPSWLALHGWLDQQAPEGDAPPISFSVKAPPADVSGGDAAAGNTLFNQACVMCHGEDAVGTERAPSLSGTGLQGDYIGLRVRTSGLANSAVYDGLTGGIMPFWAADRLSDDELRDLIAFITSTNPPPVADVTDGADGSATDVTDPVEVGPEDAGSVEVDTGGPSGCASTHPKVGWTTTLSTLFHDVKGNATIVDDCTIVVEHFYFDGNGIVVEVYGGQGGNYKPPTGFSISEDLYNFPMGYDDVTLTLTLPDGKTLDDLDGISVWCVAVGVSFGDGIFAAP